MYATSLAAAASDATRARRSPGGRSNTPATATCTGVRAAPARGGRRELAATREPRHAPTAASWLGCIMGAAVPCDIGRSDTTSSVAGWSGAVRCKGGGGGRHEGICPVTPPCFHKQPSGSCAPIAFDLVGPAHHLIAFGSGGSDASNGLRDRPTPNLCRGRGLGGR